MTKAPTTDPAGRPRKRGRVLRRVIRALRPARRCAIQPCSPGLPLEVVVDPCDGRDPFTACEMHASWLLAALPGATVEANHRARNTRDDYLRLDLDLVRRVAQSLAEEHEQLHDGTWACIMCDPSRLPA